MDNDVLIQLLEKATVGDLLIANTARMGVEVYTGQGAALGIAAHDIAAGEWVRYNPLNNTDDIIVNIGVDD